jgi:hypothetical protein
MASSQALTALLQLAGEFINQKAYVHAVSVLQACCTAASEAPTTAATARLILAQLLLEHFDNIPQAKKHLRQAELELRQTSGHLSLKCELYDTTARCHIIDNAPQQAREALLAGMALASPEATTAGAPSKDRPLLARWHAYFHFRLAQFELKYADSHATTAAMKALQPLFDQFQKQRRYDAAYHKMATNTANSSTNLTEIESVILLLSRIHLFLLQGECSLAFEEATLCGMLLEDEMEKAEAALEAANDDKDNINDNVDIDTPYNNNYNNNNHHHHHNHQPHYYQQRLVLCQQLRCHYLVMYVSICLLEGSATQLVSNIDYNNSQSQQQQQHGKSDTASNTNTLNNDGIMQMIHDSVAEVAGSEWMYLWTPTRAVVAAVHLIHAGLYRTIGKPARALVQLGCAQEVVDEGLRNAFGARGGVDRKGNPPPPSSSSSSEADTPGSALEAGKCYILLKFLVMQERAFVALLMTDLVTAGACVTELIDLIQMYPTVLQGMRPSVHFLLGMYAQSTGEKKAAVKYFKMTVRTMLAGGSGGGGDGGDEEGDDDGEHQGGEVQGGKGDAQNLGRLAALCAAMTELEMDDSNDGGAGGRALEIMTSAGISVASEDLLDRPAIEKGLTLLVHGLVLQYKGDDIGTRMYLSKALKQAHNILGNTQLVGQVLNVLAPIQVRKRDIPGAFQMFESSLTLMKGAGDLPSMLTSLRGIGEMYKSEGNEKLCEKNEEYKELKEKEAMARLEEAMRAPVHKELLQLGD